MASVTFADVWKYYGKTLAVRELNLEIKNNEFMCILGPSGCGKTTSLRMVAGLEFISSGDIYFDDVRVNDLPPKDRDIAMVFENYALYPHMTVFDNMANPLKLRGMPKREINERIARAAKLLEIEELLRRKPMELSGGQKQRTVIGRAIVREPKVFLFDEPIAHLDAQLRSHMRGELKNLQRRLETTMVYVTHDQLEGMSMADRIAVMHEGVLQQLGSPEEIYNRPTNEFVAGFVGDPRMNFLNTRLERHDSGISVVHPAFRVPLNDEQVRVLEQQKFYDKVRLGIRPDDIFIKNGVDPNSNNTGHIFVIEPLGGDMVVRIDLADDRIQVKSKIRGVGGPGDPCQVEFDVSKFHLFDTESGTAIF